MSMDHVRTISRRKWLAAAGVLGMAAALRPSAGVQAQTAAGARRLDLHHHFGSPRWNKRVIEVKRQGWVQFQDYTPARSIAAMDAAGVSTAFISCTEPGVWFGDDFAAERQDAISLSRDMNEYGARMMADYKGRFGLFAVLPLPDIDASLREIEYAFDTLKADGVGLLTSYGRIWLGDPTLAPVFDELNRRNAIVYSHPTDASCCHSLLPNTTPATVEWQTDTARAIFNVINDAGGRTSMATRYPNIRFVWSHAGGSLIGLMNRFIGSANLTAQALASTPAPNSKLHHLRRFYYDTAQSTNPLQMVALKGLVGAGQIVFGADYPYTTIVNHVEELKLIGFSDQELRGIDRENALKILPRYR
jgi:6-methylsalicylate decarboxylase